MQAEQETKNPQLLWELDFAWGWSGQGLHCQGGLCTGRQPGGSANRGLLIAGPVGLFFRGSQEMRLRKAVVSPPLHHPHCVIYGTETAIYLNAC